MKILLIEDNQQLAEDILGFLSENGFVGEHAANIAAAQDKLVVYTYDLVLLDLGLPDGNGLSLIPVIKQADSETGIIILTAMNALEDKVSGLEQGADDYLTKPFHWAELNARIFAVMRRNKQAGYDQVVIEELQIDTRASQASIDGQPLNLTKTEFKLLQYFVYNKNRLLTKEAIAEYLFGDHIDQADNFDFVYNHIKNLRKKIQKTGGIDRVKAVYGMGYKFETS